MIKRSNKIPPEQTAKSAQPEPEPKSESQAQAVILVTVDVNYCVPVTVEDMNNGKRPSTRPMSFTWLFQEQPSVEHLCKVVQSDAALCIAGINAQHLRDFICRYLCMFGVPRFVQGCTASPDSIVSRLTAEWVVNQRCQTIKEEHVVPITESDVSMCSHMAVCVGRIAVTVKTIFN